MHEQKIPVHSVEDCVNIRVDGRVINLEQDQTLDQDVATRKISFTLSSKQHQKKTMSNRLRAQLMSAL